MARPEQPTDNSLANFQLAIESQLLQSLQQRMPAAMPQEARICSGS
jgi:hypothetical protein